MIFLFIILIIWHHKLFRINSIENTLMILQRLKLQAIKHVKYVIDKLSESEFVILLYKLPHITKNQKRTSFKHYRSEVRFLMYF